MSYEAIRAFAEIDLTDVDLNDINAFDEMAYNNAAINAACEAEKLLPKFLQTEKLLKELMFSIIWSGDMIRDEKIKDAVAAALDFFRETEMEGKK